MTTCFPKSENRSCIDGLLRADGKRRSCSDDLYNYRSCVDDLFGADGETGREVTTYRFNDRS